VLLGHTPYVVQGALNQIGIVRLSPDFANGVAQGPITSPALDFPSSIAMLGLSLYAVNARFEIEPGPQVTYQLVRLPR